MDRLRGYQQVCSIRSKYVARQIFDLQLSDIKNINLQVYGMKNVILLLALGLLSVQPAHAGVFEDCQAAVERGDAAKAKEFADLILRFNTPPSPIDQVTGAACFTLARGEPYVYSVLLSAFVPAGEDGAFLLEKQRELAARQEESERRREEEARRAMEIEELSAQEERVRVEREQLVMSAAYEACVELFRRDRVAALTNERCLQFFFLTGLPEG
jgi:hypothetical protein